MTAFASLILFASITQIALGVIATLIVVIFFVNVARHPEHDHIPVKLILSIGPVVALIYAINLTRSPSSLSAAPAPIIALLVGLAMTAIWSLDIRKWAARQFENLFTPNVEVEAQPPYAWIEAQTKKGNYDAALAACEQQSAYFLGDYPLHRMWADIYATHLKDLESARQILEDYIGGKEAPRGNHATALTQLADWTLRDEGDTDRARLYFDRILEEFAGTEIGQRASQRIANLPTSETISQARNHDPIRVAAIEGDYGLRGQAIDAKYRPAESEPKRPRSEELLIKLDDHPDDSVAREELVRVYAFEEGLPQAALEEIHAALDGLFQNERSFAKWLNLEADIQLRVLNDPEAAREALQRIIRAHPNTHQAYQAQSRLARFDSELHGVAKPPQTIRLQSYDPDLGLR